MKISSQLRSAHGMKMTFAPSVNSQSTGIAIEAATFLGSSPIRRLVEDWTIDHLERTTEKAVGSRSRTGSIDVCSRKDTISHRP